jgi:hypothetical protein
VEAGVICFGAASELQALELFEVVAPLVFDAARAEAQA